MGGMQGRESKSDPSWRHGLLARVVFWGKTTYGAALRSRELISGWQYSWLHPAEVKGERVSAFVLN